MHALLSTVRYVPQPARGEAVNVGAVLACPEIGYFRASVEPERRVTRLRCLDPAFEPDTVRAVAHWIEMYEGMYLAAFGERGAESAASVLLELVRVTQGSRVQLGAPANVHFETHVGPVELDQLFEDVMEREVDWHRHVDPAVTPAVRLDFKTRVHEILRTANLYVPNSPDSPVSRDVEVRGYKFDLGFHNGRQNVVEVADIEQVHTENEIAEKAGATIAKFEVLGSPDSDDPVGKIALLSGKRRLGRSVSPIIARLVEVADAVYFLGEDQEQKKFVRYVKEATHGF